MHWGDDWHMGWMGLWWIVILVAVVGVFWLVLTTARRGSNPDSSRDRESPEDAVKRRYAEGEIDRDTYEQMLTDLRS